MDGWLVPVFPCYDQGPCFLASHTFTSLVCLVGCFYWRKIALQGCIDFCHTTTVYLFRALLLACGSLAQVCAVSQLEVEIRDPRPMAARGQGHILSRRLWRGSHCLITFLTGCTSWFHGTLLSSEQLRVSLRIPRSLCLGLCCFWFLFLSFVLILSVSLPSSLSHSPHSRPSLSLSLSWSVSLSSLSFCLSSLCLCLPTCLSFLLCPLLSLIRKAKSSISREKHGPKGYRHPSVCGVCVYIMEYYSAVKKNEVMPFAVMWMELEIVILSEVSQKERNAV